MANVLFGIGIRSTGGKKMKEYTVWFEEIPGAVTISADSKEDALEKVLQGIKEDIQVTENKKR